MNTMNTYPKLVRPGFGIEGVVLVAGGGDELCAFGSAPRVRFYEDVVCDAFYEGKEGGEEDEEETNTHVRKSILGIHTA